MHSNQGAGSSGVKRSLLPKELPKNIVLPILVITLLLGAAAGIGAFTFWYAKGLSYFSDKPEVCANCHVMNSVYEGWMKGGHQHVATCNDCHVPHDFLGKWYTKGENGLHHSIAFTLGHVPVVIRAREKSQNIAQNNCVRCHATIANHAQWGMGKGSEPLKCISCHRNAGHTHN